MCKMENNDARKSKITLVVQSMSRREKTEFRTEDLAKDTIVKTYTVTRGKTEQMSANVSELIDLLMDLIKWI